MGMGENSDEHGNGNDTPQSKCICFIAVPCHVDVSVYVCVWHAYDVYVFVLRLAFVIGEFDMIERRTENGILVR